MTLYRELRAALLGPCRVPRGDTVLVACSGGPDSLALLVGLAELAPRLGFRLAVAHLDHAQRPGSAADARSVERRARTLGLRYLGDRLAAPTRRSRAPLGEATLRARRRAYLGRAAETAGAAWIALGHTADDQAETVLLRLARGTGLAGLGGMAPRRGRWIRPLLGVTRAEVEEFLADRRLRPRRDPTNLDRRRARNRVRHAVLPELRALNPHAGEAIAAAAGRLRDLSRLVDQLARRALARTRVKAPAGAVRLVRTPLLGYPPALRECVFLQAWRTVAPPATGLTRRHLRALEELLARGIGGARVHLPGHTVARLERGLLFLGPRSRAPSDRRTSGRHRRRERERA